MSWSTPPTAVTGAVITAAFWNTGGRDNLLDLDRRGTAISDFLATSQTTTSTLYTDLGTAGPGVSVTVGSSSKLLVAIAGAISNSGANLSYMAYAISIAGVFVVSSDAQAIAHSGTDVLRTGGVFIDHSGILVASSANSIEARYKVAAGTGTWSDRAIGVVPLGA